MSLGKYLSAIADGRSPDGKEAELQKELGMGSSMIPHEAIEVRQASPVIERRGVTASPSDVAQSSIRSFLVFMRLVQRRF